VSEGTVSEGSGSEDTANPRPEEYLLKEIERDVGDDERLAELNVRLSSRGGRIVVQGAVASVAGRDAVLGLVRQRCPECEVVDELVVAEDGLSRPPARPEVIR
jgi:hypothetical protein